MRELENISLIDEFTRPGKQRSIKIEYPYDEYCVGNESYKIASKSDIELDLANLKPGQVFLEGKFSLVIKAPCDRCLKEVDIPLELSFQKELVDEEHRSKDADPDESRFIEGTDFDIGSFIEEEILMALPSKVLCSEDCKGLCPVCGCDRNVKECDCDTFVPDPRMAGIMDIFKGSKEV
ncbi:MAG: DUF177 domain-containing protein [Lachnospiraceae bacterium]|nr:DUF177 domain-containing protein [Lachnospiraceae bacterium]